MPRQTKLLPKEEYFEHRHRYTIPVKYKEYTTTDNYGNVSERGLIAVEMRCEGCTKVTKL